METLREFCLLRAESIQGQLDGTIPSTSDGQSEDSSALIDASSLNISDLGSMNGNMGGGMGGMERPEDMEPPAGSEEEPSQSQEDSSNSEEDGEEESSQAAQGEAPQEEPPSRAMPEGGQVFPQDGSPPGGVTEGEFDGGTIQVFAEKSQNTP